MEVIVERVEDNYLVLELPNLKHINVSKELVPKALEGDVIDININYNKRKNKEEEIKLLSDKLFVETNDLD